MLPERGTASPAKRSLKTDPVGIIYMPEEMIEKGLAMMEPAKKTVCQLLLGSKMQPEAWSRDFKSWVPRRLDISMLAKSSGWREQAFIDP